jgi:hypothetical protein
MTFALPVATMRTLAFLGALGLTINEGISRGPERPSLYVLYLGMMTAAIGFGRGEQLLDKFRNNDDEDER